MKPLIPRHHLGREVNLAARQMRAMLDSRLLAAGTTFATWTVLFTLDGEGSIIQRELAQRMEIEGPTLVRRLDMLEAEGLISRSDSPTDRRVTRVSLTAAGRALFRRVRTSVVDIEGELLEGIAPREVETTRKVLRHLIDASRRLTRNPNALRLAKK